MMGDRDYRNLINTAIDSIGRELEPKIDVRDIKTIHLYEVVRCLRRSYFDRIDPLETKRTGFNDLLSGLLRKLQYGSKPGDFELDEIKLRGDADMMVDDAVMVFRSAEVPPEVPESKDILYLNACMWIFNKTEGVITYVSGNRQEVSFSLTRNKKIFEEVIRRVRVLYDLFKEQKIPILEPSKECSTCQYYERCYMQKKLGRSISLHELVGLKKN